MDASRVAAQGDSSSPWRARFEGLARTAAITHRDPWEGLAGNDTELRYVIDAPATRITGEVTLEVFEHRRLKSGAWSSGKSYSVDARGSRPLDDPLDRRVLALLRGAQREDVPDWYHYSRYSRRRRTSRELALGPDLCYELLPLLGASGRCYWHAGGSAEAEPLRWDDGEPWTLRLEVSRDEELGECVLAGVLVRGDERMGLDEPELLLASGLLFARNTCARFDARGAFAAVVDLRRRGPLRAPLDDEGELVAELARLPGQAQDPVQGGAAGDLLAPVPRMNVEPGGRRGRGHLECWIRFGYGPHEVDATSSAEAIPREDGRVGARDLEAERGALRRFLECGGKPVRPADSVGCHGRVAPSDFVEMVRALTSEGWAIEAEGVKWRSPGALSASVRSGQDWFDLEGGVEFGDQVAPFPELLDAAREGRDTVRLADGSVGILPERWLADWGLLEIAGEAEGEALRFPRNQGWILDALLAEREGVAVDGGFERLREGLARSRGLGPKREPRSFRGALRAYQRDGLGWFEYLRELGLGGCLADDMGLGKTVQVLALLEARRLARRRAKGESSPSLVVAPRSLVFNWIDEAARFAPRLAVVDYAGAGRRERWDEAPNADLLVTTYGTLRRDAVELADRHFEYVVLDEAQAIKNASSQAAKSARLLDASHRLALSGTPIENHLGELWSLFEFLNPGMLGRSRAFRSMASKSVRKGEGADLGALARAVRPFFLRRTKEEVLDDLPPKTEQTLHCELGKRERKDYEELRQHYRSSLLARAADVGVSRMKIQVLEALLRLRQAACHPGLIDADRAGEASAKLEVLLPMLEEVAAEGHKALVFSQFTRLLALVRARLDARGLVYEYLDGRTRKRKEKVERFQNDPDCPLFLISLKAGGHGLNLTAGDYVFLLDPWWNPAVEAQAVDRAYRIGRTRPVTAYRLIARDTVEEKVLALQEEKRELADAILGEGGSALRQLTREDLEQLLS